MDHLHEPCTQTELFNPAFALIPVDDMNTIYSKTLKISSDILQDFNLKIDKTVISCCCAIFSNFVFVVVQGSARVLNIKKTRKTRGGLMANFQVDGLITRAPWL